MTITCKMIRVGLVLAAVVVFGGVKSADGQEPAKAEPQAEQASDTEEPDEKCVLRTYDVGDLVINVQDHPYSEVLNHSTKPAGGGGGGGFGGGGGGGGIFSVPDGAGVRIPTRSQTASRGTGQFTLCQFGGGGQNSSDQSEESLSSSAISMDDLQEVLVGTVDSDTWAENGGAGKVHPLGTSLVVWQTPTVHHHIEELLKQIRKTAGLRKTLTVDARWLLLNSDELDSLLTKDSTGLLEVERKSLAAFTRRGGSIRGITNCFSGQLVYLVAGTQRNIVSGYIPVVGSLQSRNEDASIVSLRSSPRIQLVADTQSPDFSKSRGVGYQPITTNLNLGTVLEIRPTLSSDGGAVVELKSTLTAASEHAAENDRPAKSDALAPAVDRIAVETQELATTLRVPLGKPILVGGMTYISSTSIKASDDSKSSERPQFYLVLEVR